MDFFTALQQEIAALQADLKQNPDPRVRKLEELTRVQALYAGQHQLEPRRPLPDLPKASASEPAPTIGSRRHALGYAKAIVAEAGAVPIKTSAVYEKLLQRGIRVPGSNPQNNLSAMMYNSGDFLSHGRAGWTLKTGKPSDTEPSKGGMSEGLAQPPASPWGDEASTETLFKPASGGGT